MRLQRTAGIERPPFVVTPLAEGLAWRGDGSHRFEEKIDGVTHILEVTPSFAEPMEGRWARLWGELVRSTFYAIDCLEYNGEDLRSWPRRESLKVLDTILREPSNLEHRTSNLEHGESEFEVQQFNSSIVQCSFRIVRPSTGVGGEFLEAVLARGGEGVVASLLDEPFAATRWKCKRVETFYCAVTEKHAGGKQSVRLGAIEWREVGEQGYTPGLHGEVTPSFAKPMEGTRERGWLPLFGHKFEQVRVGSVLKVEGYGLTAAGKIREPRVCKDTATSWLVQF